MHDFITFVLNSDMISDKKIIEHLKIAKSYFKNVQPIDDEYPLSSKYLEYLKNFILDYASNNKIIDVLSNLELSFFILNEIYKMRFTTKLVETVVLAE